MIKLTLPILLTPLTHIINICLEKDYFPKFWSKAVLVHIPKVNDPKVLGDLRPISLLPILSKVLEKIAKEQIVEHFECHKLFPKTQSGFRKIHSTITALLDLSDNIIKALDKKLAVALLSIDFSKAFYKINHKLLLAKLQYYGFDYRILSFLKHYLCDRYTVIHENRRDLF